MTIVRNQPESDSAAQESTYLSMGLDPENREEQLKAMLESEDLDIDIALDDDSDESDESDDSEESPDLPLTAHVKNPLIYTPQIAKIDHVDLCKAYAESIMEQFISGNKLDRALAKISRQFASWHDNGISLKKQLAMFADYLISEVSDLAEDSDESVSQAWIDGLHEQIQSLIPSSETANNISKIASKIAPYITQESLDMIMGTKNQVDSYSEEIREYENMLHNLKELRQSEVNFLINMYPEIHAAMPFTLDNIDKIQIRNGMLDMSHVAEKIASKRKKSTGSSGTKTGHVAWAVDTHVVRKASHMLHAILQMNGIKPETFTISMGSEKPFRIAHRADQTIVIDVENPDQKTNPHFTRFLNVYDSKGNKMGTGNTFIKNVAAKIESGDTSPLYATLRPEMALALGLDAERKYVLSSFIRNPAGSNIENHVKTFGSKAGMDAIATFLANN